MTRRKYAPIPAGFPEPERRNNPIPRGIFADADSICDRCHGPMNADEGVRIVKWHGIWVHETCTPGGDDE